jgi:enoyl-CoA hydratase
MTATILTDLTNGLATVTLNRPERHNAMNDAMVALYRSIMLEVLDDDAVRVVLLRANGPSFCSGRDTTELGTRSHGETDFVHVHRAQQMRLAMLDSPKPVVCEVRGHAIGGGCEMALSCDIRVADTTLQMSFPEVRYAITVDTGASVLATSLVGPSKAKYMIMTGDRIDATTAEKWGLVDFVVPPDELEAKARGIAERLAANAPLAVQMGKQLVDNVWANAVRTALRSELMAQTALFTSRDRAEFKAATAEKRAPEFNGR